MSQQHRRESVLSVGKKRGTGDGMTRQEEWGIQDTVTADMFEPAPATVSQATGWHKRNTRDRGEYNGYTKSAVLKLIQRSQNAQKKKRHFVCSPSERDAMSAYYDERLASAGVSMSAGTPDWLTYDGRAVARVAVTPVGPFIPCGSIECRPEKW